MRLRRTRLGGALVLTVVLALLTTVIVMASEPFGPLHTYAIPMTAGDTGPVSEASWVALADLRGVGVKDMVVADKEDRVFSPSCLGTPCHRVAIIKGKGDGTFEPTAFKSYWVSNTPKQVVVADVNKDGKLDLLVIQEAPPSLAAPVRRRAPSFADQGVVAVLLGNGDGTFKNVDGTSNSPTNTALTYGNIPNARELVVGNFHGLTGTVDLAVLGEDAFTSLGLVQILDGHNDGTFTQDTNINGNYTALYKNLGDDPHSLAVGDLDGDGHLDLVVALQGAGGSELDTLPILWGLGGGKFTKTATPPRTSFVRTCPVSSKCEPESVALADLNGDGVLDVVVANGDKHTVSVILGDAVNRGSFMTAVSYPTPKGPAFVLVADMNLDGKLDIVVLNEDNTPQASPAPSLSGQVSVLPGMGDGTFGTALSTGMEPRSDSGSLMFALGDLNGDGIPDVVVPLDDTFPGSSPSPGISASTTVCGGVTQVRGCISILLAQADLKLKKTHSGIFMAGSNATYEITVTNPAVFAAAGGATVVDNLPAGMAFVSGTGTGWTCSAAGQKVTCKHPGPVLASTTSKITLTVAIASGTSGSLTNQARVTSLTPDPVPANNSGVDAVSVQAAPGLPKAGSGPH